MSAGEQGFIFLMTLIISAVISILLLASMHHTLLYYKAVNTQDTLDQRFYDLEEFALRLAGKRTFKEECTVHQDAANQVIKKLSTHQGCIFNKEQAQFYYLIEDLGAFPCVRVLLQGKKYGSYHRRISVLYVEEGYSSSLLQVRVISRGVAASCHTTAHVINAGISSWRYLALVGDKMVG